MRFAEPVREEFKTSLRAGGGAPSTRPRSTRVSTTKVHPPVWRVALRLAEGDGLRIEVVNEREVVVRNRRR